MLTIPLAFLIPFFTVVVSLPGSYNPSFLRAANLATVKTTVLKPEPKWKVDSIAVHKGERKLLAFWNSRLVKTYNIALGANPKGPKQFQGDCKTPEGLYYIDNKNPYSDFYKNLGISYPDDAEKAWAKEFGRSAGGDIKIHGTPNGYTNKQIRRLVADWTLGCIALTNKEIDELFEAVEIGTPISINP